MSMVLSASVRPDCWVLDLKSSKHEELQFLFVLHVSGLSVLQPYRPSQISSKPFIPQGQSKGSCTLSLKFFHIRHHFLSKCLLQMRKRRKSNLIQFFL